MAGTRSPRSAAAARAATTGSPRASVAPFDRVDALVALAVAGIVWIVFHRATGYFFGADDFEGLARARGLLPGRTGLARLLPWRLYFALFDRAFGLVPLPYHLASLAALSACSALVYAWVRGLAGRAAALVGAACFAAHPAHYAAAYWISAIGDPLALLFALATLMFVRTAGPVRWTALPMFALALLSKETALLVPAVAFLDPGRSRALPPARRDPVAWTVAGMSLAMGIYYLTSDPIGTRHSGAEAYAPTLGIHVVLNLLTYAGWSANFVVLTLREISDRIEPQSFAIGAVLLLVAGVAALWKRTRERGALAGGALWVVMLAPVLPLAHHTYRYYLCGPLAGLALALAAAFDLGFGALQNSSRATLAVAALLAALLAWNGFLVTRNLEFAPFMVEGLRSDSVVDRALIAGRVAEGLRATPPPAGVTLRFWSPMARRLEGLPDSVEKMGYLESNVKVALLGDVGVRLLAPQVGRVEFVPRFTPAGDSVWYAVYRLDGSMRAGPAPALEKALAGMGATR